MELCGWETPALSAIYITSLSLKVFSSCVDVPLLVYSNCTGQHVLSPSTPSSPRAWLPSFLALPLIPRLYLFLIPVCRRSREPFPPLSLYCADLLFKSSLTIVRDLFWPSLLLSRTLPVLLLWFSSHLCWCPSPSIHFSPAINHSTFIWQLSTAVFPENNIYIQLSNLAVGLLCRVVSTLLDFKQCGKNIHVNL